MTALDELCESITEQLKSFDQHNAKIHRVLQEENLVLRATLATLSSADRGASTPKPPPSYTAFIPATPTEQLGVFTVISPQRHGVSKTNTLKTSRLNFSTVDSLNTSLHTEGFLSPPWTPSGEKKASSTPSDAKDDAQTKQHEIRNQKSDTQLECMPARSSLFSSRGSIFSFSDDSGELGKVVSRWRKMVSTMNNMALLGVDRSKLENALLLRPAWELTKFDRPSGRVTVSTWLTSSSGIDFSRAVLLGSDAFSPLPLSKKVSRWSRFILHPESRVVTTWSLLGALMILYDILTFPLAGFDLDESDFALVVMWISTLFWTSDILLTFVRGVHYRGVIEMRPSRILWLYLKSWLVIDVAMVSIDWLVLYMTSGGDSSIAGASKVLRSGKALRAARVVRVIRLIRTIKVLQYLRDVFENIKSEYNQLFLKLAASIVAILVLSHYVTCSWFAQAHFNNAEKTWITVFLGNDPRPHFGEEYVTSMHFSLTQLAGSQNIVPQNAQERFIASVIIVFDIVIFSTLVGIITDIMAQFRSLTFERSKEVNLIRKFFTRAEMPPLLESRIWHFFRKHYRSKNRCVNECEIEFFRYLPSSLKMDLHQHLYIPVLSKHPLFQCVMKRDRYSLLAVCVSALTSATLVSDTEVFAEGDIAKFMFFVTTGSLQYKAKQFGFDCQPEQGGWVAEAALWTKWMHCGRLTTETNCELLKVDAEMFEKTILDRAETSEWFKGMRNYAARFAQRVSDSFDSDRPITDVDANLDAMLETIVEKSFFYLKGIGSEMLDIESPREDNQQVLHTPLAASLKKAMSTISSLSLSSKTLVEKRLSRVSHRGEHVVGKTNKMDLDHVLED